MSRRQVLSREQEARAEAVQQASMALHSVYPKDVTPENVLAVAEWILTGGVADGPIFSGGSDD